MEEQFERSFGAPPQAVFSAAGRVNLIGEHVDYCGGRVLPAALSLRCRVAVRRNGTRTLRLAATTLPDLAVIDLDRTENYRALAWGNYQAGVADVMKRAGYRLVGCDILYDCSVPFGAGLSSSAAIEVATAVALARAGENPVDPVRLALLCREAESGYCGVNCGIMDQFASANGRAGHAIFLDCATLAHEFIPLRFEGCAFVLANSNSPHRLLSGKYNERRRETEEAGALLRRPLAQMSEEELSDLGRALPPLLLHRARHVVSECARVARSVKACRAGDAAGFGALLNASHLSLKEDFAVTGEALDALAEEAWARPECLGARMTGAGFGGCTVNLVRAEKTEQFIAAVGEGYRRRTGREATFYVAQIADGIVEERCDFS